MEDAASVPHLSAWVCSVYSESKLSDGFLAIGMYSLLTYNIHKMLEILQKTLYDLEAVSLWKEGSTEVWLESCKWLWDVAKGWCHQICTVLVPWCMSYFTNFHEQFSPKCKNQWRHFDAKKKIYSFKRNKDLSCNKDFYKALWWNLSFITWVIMFSCTVWCFLWN